MRECRLCKPSRGPVLKRKYLSNIVIKPLVTNKLNIKVTKLFIDVKHHEESIQQLEDQNHWLVNQEFENDRRYEVDTNNDNNGFAESKVHEYIITSTCYNVTAVVATVTSRENAPLHQSVKGVHKITGEIWGKLFKLSHRM